MLVTTLKALLELSVKAQSSESLEVDLQGVTIFERTLENNKSEHLLENVRALLIGRG